MKPIKFARDFSKLTDPYFTTIRKQSINLSTGRQYLLQTPTAEFPAILIRQHTYKISEISTKTLTHDTDTDSREEALEVLREFYPDLDENSQVKLLYFTKGRGIS